MSLISVKKKPKISVNIFFGQIYISGSKYFYDIDLNSNPTNPKI